MQLENMQRDKRVNNATIDSEMACNALTAIESDNYILDDFHFRISLDTELHLLTISFFLSLVRLKMFSSGILDTEDKVIKLDKAG
jgi:hypothetical protein